MTLELHYPLVEESGATAYDYSGNEHNGDIIGAGPQGTGTVTGPFGNSAYDFDGSNDRVETNYSPSGDERYFTWSAWIKPDNTSSSHAIIDNYDGNLKQTSFRINSNTDSIFVSSRDANGDLMNVDGTTIVNDGVWHHGSLVREGNTIYVYVDGVQDGSDSNNSTGDSVSNMTINIGDDVQTKRQFPGLIADARIYNRALSPHEVQALYQAGVTSSVTLHDS